jgi:exodeoxyribonuclease VII large subunit
MTTAPKYRVSQVGHTIQAVLREHLGKEYWVYGELTGYDRANKDGHVYPTLCEYDTQGQVIARLSLCIFKNDHIRVLQQVQRSPHPFKLADGIEVCLKLRLDFYVPSGRMSGIVSEIDPLHTLEEAKRRRYEILKKLEADGIKDLNRSLPAPTVITRIGLITADKSAAEADFLSELKKSGYAFRVTLCPAVMQGKQTEPSVLAALEHLYRTNVEAICITRGGGDVTDLQWFDNEKIARCILGHPVPVYSGIGHEIDRCVIDEIAKESFKTPTALAHSFVEKIDSFLYVMHMHVKKMREITGLRWQETSAQFGYDAERLADTVRALLLASRQTLAGQCQTLKSSWHDHSTGQVLQLHSGLAALRGALREKTGTVRHRLLTGQDRMRQILRQCTAERKSLLIGARGMGQGAKKIVRQHDPSKMLRVMQYASKLGFTRVASVLNAWETKISQADPILQFKRGYTLTTRANGRPLSAGGFTPDELLVTKTYQHTLTSRLTEATDEGKRDQV